MKKRKIELIDDWRKAWRMLSVQAAALEVSLLSLKAAQPEFESMEVLKPVVESTGYHWATMVLGVAIIVLRVVKQPALRRDEL